MYSLRRKGSASSRTDNALLSLSVVAPPCSAADLLEMSKSTFVQTEALRVTKLGNDQSQFLTDSTAFSDDSTPRLFRTPSEEDLEAELLSNNNLFRMRREKHRKSLLVLLDSKGPPHQKEAKKASEQRHFSLMENVVVHPQFLHVVVPPHHHNHRQQPPLLPNVSQSAAGTHLHRHALRKPVAQREFSKTPPSSTGGFLCCEGVGSGGESPAFSGTSSSGLSSMGGYMCAGGGEKTPSSSLSSGGGSLQMTTTSSSLLLGGGSERSAFRPYHRTSATGGNNSSSPYDYESASHPVHNVHGVNAKINGGACLLQQQTMFECPSSTECKLIAMAVQNGEVKAKSADQPPPIPPKTDHVRLLMHRRRRKTEGQRHLSEDFGGSDDHHSSLADESNTNYLNREFPDATIGARVLERGGRQCAGGSLSTTLALKKTASLSAAATACCWRPQIVGEKNGVTTFGSMIEENEKRGGRQQTENPVGLPPPKNAQSATTMSDGVVTTFSSRQIPPQPLPRRRPPIPLPRTLRTPPEKSQQRLQRSQSIGATAHNNHHHSESIFFTADKQLPLGDSHSLMVQSMYYQPTAAEKDLLKLSPFKSSMSSQQARKTLCAATNIFCLSNSATIRQSVQTFDDDDEIAAANNSFVAGSDAKGGPLPTSPSISLSFEFSSSHGSTMTSEGLFSGSWRPEATTPKTSFLSNAPMAMPLAHVRQKHQQNNDTIAPLPRRRSFRQMKQQQEQQPTGQLQSKTTTLPPREGEEDVEFTSRIRRWEEMRRRSSIPVVAAETSSEAHPKFAINAYRQNLQEQPEQEVLLHTVVSAQPAVTQTLDVVLIRRLIEAEGAECRWVESDEAWVAISVPQLNLSIATQHNTHRALRGKTVEAAPPLPPRRLPMCRHKSVDSSRHLLLANNKPVSQLAQSARVIQWIWESNKLQHLGGTVV